MLVMVLAGTLSGEKPAHKYWWQIKLVISTEGHYENSTPFAPFKGEYTFDYVMKAGMERDNGDYILFKGDNYTENITWKPDGHDSAAQTKEKGLAGMIDLAGEFNYIMRKDGKILVDCEMIAVPLPYMQGSPIKSLVMPHTAENQRVNPQLKYNKGVSRGSNKVEIPEERIYREKEVKQTFSWLWQKDDDHWTSFHKVKFTLVITRLEKK